MTEREWDPVARQQREGRFARVNPVPTVTGRLLTGRVWGGDHDSMIAVCPSCDKRMAAYVLDGVEVDACGHCGGLWLDEGEISDLTDAARQPDLPTDALLAEMRAPTQAHSGRPRLCPRCVTPLRELVLPQLAHCPATVLDCCPQGHGLFFDKNELGAMLRRHHGPESPLTQFLIQFFGPSLLGSDSGPSSPTPSQSLEAS